MIQRWRTATRQYAWYNVLPDIIKNYNNTYHGTIKAKPIDVKNGKDTNKQIINVTKHLIQVGDLVRTINPKSKFTKGDAEKYSRIVYTVSRIDGNKIFISSDHELCKYFKEYELLKIDKTENIKYNETEEQEHLDSKKKKKIRNILSREGIL